MKRLFLASVFGALPLGAQAADLYTGPTPSFDYASPAPAEGLLAGGIGELGGGYRWVDTNDEGGQDAALINGAGRYSIPFGDAFSVQFDLDGEYNFTDNSGDASGDDENPQGFWVAGGHASWRDPSRGLLGIFAAAGEGYNTADEPGEVGWMAGLEGQLYLGDLTLYLQGGYADFPYDTDEGEGFRDGWFTRGVARWFVGADSVIEGEVSYGQTDAYIDGGEDEGEIWNWGVKGKTRISKSMPVYGVLGYRGGRYTTDPEGDRLTEHTVYGAISVLFGAGDLRENDRRAATLDMPLLPVRASSITESVD